MSNRDLPLSRGADPEHPASCGIIEDLLSGLNEWRNVQDIVRLSIRALADLAKSQGHSLKEVQFYQSDYALKSEVASNLALKANLSDLSRAISETRASLDNKVSYEEVRSVLEDRVSKSDMLHLLQGKVSVEEFRTAIEFKVDVKELQNEIKAIRNAFDDLRGFMVSNLQNCASLKNLAVLEKVVESKADLSEVNAALNEKATKTSVANALHKKANKADVDELIAGKVGLEVVNGIVASIDNKVSASAFNKLAAEVEKKVDLVAVDRSLKEELSKKSGKEEVDTLLSSLNQLKRDVEIKLQQQSILFSNYVSDLKSELDLHKMTFLSQIEKKAEFKEIERLSEMVLKKLDSDEATYLLSSFKNDYSSYLNSQQQITKQELKRLDSTFKEQLNFIENKHKAFESEQFTVKDQIRGMTEKLKQDLEDFAKTSERSKNEESRQIRYDLEKLQRELEDTKRAKHEDTRRSDKFVYEDLESKVEVLNAKLQDLALTAKDSLVKTERDLQTFANSLSAKTQSIDNLHSFVEDFKSNSVKRQDWESAYRHLAEDVERLGKEVLLKANIKDICTLLDIKANIDDVTHALEDLHGEIDSKVAVEELSEKLKEQSCINEALCAENCVARWLWKSGENKTGSVPWEVQSLNTCPENFVWEKDKTNVLTLSPGLYSVAFGVFTRKKSPVCLMINGETVISDTSVQGKVIGKHSSGNVVGFTCSEFLSLPARARISVGFNGEPSEGFLMLKKL